MANQAIPSVAVFLSVFLGLVSCQPRVLTSFTEVVSYLMGGAPLQVNVDIKFCAQAFPKSLPSYSFTEKLDYVILSDVGLEFNRITAVNGSRLQLSGPATRFYQMKLDASGSVNFQIKDINPQTRAVIVSGTIACRIGSGFTPVAQSGQGTPLTTFSLIVSSLRGGNRVFVAIDLTKCISRNHGVQTLRADNFHFFAEVINYRFNENGSIAFSRQIPILDEKDKLINGYGDIKTNPDGSTDVFYYTYSSGSPVQPVRQHWACQLGDSINYFRQ